MSAPPGRKEFRALSKFALLATTVLFFQKKIAFVLFRRYLFTRHN